MLLAARRSRDARQPDSEWSCVTSELGVSSGRHYWEVHVDATVDGNIMVGVCPCAVDAPRGGVAYKAPSSMMYYCHNGRRYGDNRHSAYSTNTTPCRAGDTIGVLLEVLSSLMKRKKHSDRETRCWDDCC